MTKPPVYSCKPVAGLTRPVSGALKPSMLYYLFSNNKTKTCTTPSKKAGQSYHWWYERIIHQPVSHYTVYADVHVYTHDAITDEYTE